ncbi:FKBP-type peptidyl-prolyl cis-trans isomerase [Marinomonas posidonica]|uniref:Peptidyl-prolyl cis-trans isomerase n=1 Tax=Marinomonas posidonica (strain CECT 7376 / NCIMB 14433 / IVIA-Po-181) TaxID=491952 RepID=F6CTU5_MARPP|nr:FKBP-type peptidyl-prolyl cis-trans isomerase [Marinomonas posidonica]AEF56314.1 Peptidylprolyl isomerase [Marinomonas posidonica IVIA-Po-181]
MTSITAQSQITLHFELALEDGQVVDSNFEQAPASFRFGDGSLLPAFEASLLGLKAGDESSFTMAPEKAFGAHNESNLQRIPRSQFEMDLEEGMVVSFADMSKNELPGVIAEIGEKDVLVDFNHPLAGRTLTFKVQIIEVEESA